MLKKLINKVCATKDKVVEIIKEKMLLPEYYSSAQKYSELEQQVEALESQKAKATQRQKYGSGGDDPFLFHGRSLLFPIIAQSLPR